MTDRIPLRYNAAQRKTYARHLPISERKAPLPASPRQARRSALAIGIATTIVVLLTAGMAQAVPASSPDDTAMVDGTSVRTIVQAGNLVWLGGSFDTVKDGNGSTIRSVSNLVAFKADASGALATGVNFPSVTNAAGSAIVYDLSLLGNTLYLAGTFDKVDGQARSNVAAIDASTGALLPFNTNAGPANAVLATPTAIYVGTSKILSFQPNGANTPGFTAPKAYIDGSLRAHNTIPQVRDIKLQGSTLVAACQCDSMTDSNNPTAPGRLVKAVVEVNATTGALTSWAPANLPTSSGAFGITVLVHDFPGTSTPTVYLAAGGSDFTAAYDFGTGAQRFKTDTSGSSQTVTWYQGALVIGGHFNWSDSPAANGSCGDNANPNTTCYHTPKLVSMDAATGRVILGPNNVPWNPGICCAYNGVWALTTGDDGSTLHVGGEFTQVGGTWSGSGTNWTLNGANTQRYYARLGGPAASTQTLTITKTGTGTGTVTSAPAGIDCGTVCTVDISTGQSVTLTAAPAAGSIFTGWSGGGCSGMATCTVSMGQAQNVAPRFDLPTYALTVTKTGGGTGTVTSAPAGVNCGSTCSFSFNGGTLVTLTAAPTGNNIFSGWGGNCSGTGTCTVTMDAARAVTATILAGSKLTVTTAGTGTGTVSSNPGGIACPATCSANVPTGSPATLTATPSAGSTFTGFTGGCVSATSTCTLSMTGSKTVTATFAAAQTLTVTPAGTGTGTVTTSPAGISCGATCAAGFTSGTSVTLSASPSAGSSFSGWSGSCSGTGPCVVSMTAARSVTATFTQTTQPLGLTVAGVGHVTSSPGGIDCPATCSASFGQGASVTLTEAPAPNQIFLGWSGDAAACGTASSCPIVMGGPRSVAASFGPAEPTLLVTTGGAGSGSVVGDLGGIDCPATTCSASYPQGTVVTLTATADAGFVFAGWGGGGCSGTSTCQVTMTDDTTVTASFAVLRTLAVSTAGAGAGSVTGSSGAIDCPASTCSTAIASGTSITLTATAGSGSVFTGWTGDCSGSGSCVLTMSSDRTVTATFEPTHPLHVDVAGAAFGKVTGLGGIDCGATCDANIRAGQTVTLSATPVAGATFSGWTGDCSGLTPTCDLSMDQPRSATATFAPPQIVHLADNDLAVAYNGWRGVTDADANGRAYRVSNVTNDTLTWKSATTTSFSWVTRKGPDRGIADVSIDGVDHGTVDLYAATAQGATIVYSGLTSKVHTVIITVTGTKNPASSGRDVVLDAFTVGATTTQESNDAITFGTWKSVANASADGGTYRWASEATASVTVSFDGTGIDWITNAGGSFGKASVTIDGVSQGIVDLYAANQQWQRLVSYGGLTPGNHSMVIQVLNQKNAASGSTKIFMDGFIVHA